ncbi:MAG: M3 family metallopeptidase [Bacteroidales bacterium]|nr:M3 family metallopeptidase [Bacteroidales bacterium]
MRKTLMTILVSGLVLASCSQKQGSDNPLLQTWDTPFETAPFEKIKVEHYLPAFEAAMAEHDKEIQAIIDNAEAPTFDNTIAALDYSGQTLTKVAGVFYNMMAANTSEELQKVNEQIGPMMATHSDNVSMNAKLFEKIKAVYDAKDSQKYTGEQLALLEKTYKQFVRSGALLDAEKQAELREVNAELTKVEAKFDANLLKETKSYQLVIDNQENLKGLPQGEIEKAAALAKQEGKEGKWIFTLDNPSFIPFVTYADNRDLRKEIFNARVNRCNNGGETDNNSLVAQMAELRAKKAQLLGYETFAHYQLEERMAKEPKAVFDLLENLLTYSVKVAKEEAKEFQALLSKDVPGATLEAWDMYYYAEKVRQQKYNFDAESTRPYFEINNVRQGCFDVLTKLYGISFEERKDVSVYAEDVLAFEAKNEKGEHVGILYWDPYTRPSKGAGAWCNEYRGQSRKDGKDITPIITVCFNYAKSPNGVTTLTADEALTVFHEMGHAIHQLLSNCTYPSVSGTNVARDFVELPSQILEHWCLQPEVLQMYAKNEKGEVIPQEIVAKMEAAGNFNQGFMFSEILAASYLDMCFHSVKAGEKVNTQEVEKSAMAKIGMLSQIPPRYRSTYFSHCFGDGGYSAGYYSYTWSETLDADAFEAFKETGNIFDPATAAKFKTLLSSGSTKDAMQLYKDFRGAEPDLNALLRNRGLIK